MTDTCMRTERALPVGDRLRVSELLYHHDGPRMFGAAYAGRLRAFLCVDCEEDGVDATFLVAPTTAAHLEAVLRCEASCRSLFEAPSHVVRLDHGLLVTAAWTCSRADVGDDMLPEPGLGLRTGSRAPDAYDGIIGHLVSNDAYDAFIVGSGTSGWRGMTLGGPDDYAAALATGTDQDLSNWSGDLDGHAPGEIGATVLTNDGEGIAVLDAGLHERRRAFWLGDGGDLTPSRP